MKKSVKIKVNGKINIGLNVLGEKNGYHILDTVMAEINLYDTIALTTRKDNKINLTVKGCNLDDIAISDNNVYKTAVRFMEAYNTNGADIVLTKNIPIGSGLGGSSADIVGTVKAFCKAYSINKDVIPFLRELCSDGEFLYNGGFARITGKGEVAERFSVKNTMYMVIIVPDVPSVTAEVFKKLDQTNYPKENADIDNIIAALKVDGEIEEREIFNALMIPASELNKDISSAYNSLKELSPKNIFMSGSGSAVVGIFDSIDLCLWAKSKLASKFEQIYVKETVESR